MRLRFPSVSLEGNTRAHRRARRADWAGAAPRARWRTRRVGDLCDQASRLDRLAASWRPVVDHQAAPLAVVILAGGLDQLAADRRLDLGQADASTTARPVEQGPHRAPGGGLGGPVICAAKRRGATARRPVGGLRRSTTGLRRQRERTPFAARPVPKSSQERKTGWEPLGGRFSSVFQGSAVPVPKVPSVPSPRPHNRRAEKKILKNIAEFRAWRGAGV